MAQFFSDLTAQLKGIWARLDAGQRLTVGAVLLAAVVGMATLVWVANRADYHIVHSATSSAELRDAQQALSQEGIAFQAAGDGMALAVDRDDLERAHQALSSAGLRAEGGEDEDMKSSFMQDRRMREFLLNRTRLREVARELRSMRGVRGARIQATVPEPRVFRRDQDMLTPRGNVILELTPGAVFEDVARAAIQHAAAAIGIKEEFFTATDSATQRIYNPDPDRADLHIGEFEELQRRRSDELTAKAQAYLDRAYEGKVLVSVNVELDPEYEIREEDILPEEPRIVEQTTKKKTSVNELPAVAGDPSVAAEANGTARRGGRSGGTKTSDETKDVRYYGKQGTRRLGQLAPDMRAMSCALIVDENLGLDAAKIEEVSGAVKAMIGWRPEFSDESFRVLVQTLPEVEPVEMDLGPGLTEQLLEWAPIAGQILGVAMVLLFLRSMLRRGRPAPVAREEAAPAAEEKEPSAEESARRMRREIERAIADDPATISKLFDSWLSEVKS